VEQFESQIIANPIKEFIASKQTQVFQVLKHSQFTGELWLHNVQGKWVVYLYLGRILYATGGIHPLRRWRRNVYLFFPKHGSVLMEKVPSVIQQTSNICWEYDLLCSFLSQNLITRGQLVQMIKHQITEILFDLTQSKQIIHKVIKKNLSPTIIIPIDSNEVIVEAWKLSQDWQMAITDCSPNAAPIITQPEQLRLRTSEKTHQALNKLLSDRLTLRELALQVNQSVVQLVRLLIPYIQEGLIALVDIPDLNINYPYKSSPSQQYFVISIFRKAAFTQHLEPILKEYGYKYLNINHKFESLANIGQLKPDLLLLEWRLLKKGGTTLVSNINKLKEDLKLPIIALGENISFLEKIQAKSTGCDRVLSLPIVPETLVNILQHYLP